MQPRPVLIRLILPFAATMALLVVACGLAVYYAGQRDVQFEQINDLDRLASLVRIQVTGSIITDSQHKQIQDLSLPSWGTRHHAHRRRWENIARHAGRPRQHGKPQRPARSPSCAQQRLWQQRSSQRHDPSAGTVYVAMPLDRQSPRRNYSFGSAIPKASGRKSGGRSGRSLSAATAAARGADDAAGRHFCGGNGWARFIRSPPPPIESPRASGARMSNPRGSGGAEIFLAERLNLAAEHAEEQLAVLTHQRADLQALVDSLPDPIFLVDAQGRIGADKSCRRQDRAHAARAGGGGAARHDHQRWADSRALRFGDCRRRLAARTDCEIRIGPRRGSEMFTRRLASAAAGGACCWCCETSRRWRPPCR